MVRGKFVVSQINLMSGGDKLVILVPVTSGSEENKSFSKYTPSGKIEMYITKDTQAVDAFEVGKEYYVDFSPAFVPVSA